MKYLGIIAGLLLLAGCGNPMSEMSKETMAQPVDCANAKNDVAALQKEKVSVLERIGAGAGFIVPVGVIVNIFQQSSGKGVVLEERKAVASGDYNKAIDAKIAEIKETCKI